MKYGGCDVVVDAYHMDNQSECFSLHLATYFNPQKRSFQLEDIIICYEYGFERALIELKLQGVDIDITSPKNIRSDKKISYVYKDNNYSEHAKHSGFSIGLALKGLLPWVSVNGKGGISDERKQSKGRESSESVQFEVMTLRPVGHCLWEVTGWNDPDGYLRGDVSGASEALCVLRERADQRKVDVRVRVNLSDLSVGRRAGDGSLERASGVNREAVATALLADALFKSERISEDDENTPDMAGMITLARAGITSIDENEGHID